MLDKSNLASIAHRSYTINSNSNSFILSNSSFILSTQSTAIDDLRCTIISISMKFFIFSFFDLLLIFVYCFLFFYYFSVHISSYTSIKCCLHSYGIWSISLSVFIGSVTNSPALSVVFTQQPIARFFRMKFFFFG